LKEHAKLLRDMKENSDMTWVGLMLLWTFLAPGIGYGVGAAVEAAKLGLALIVPVSCGVVAGLLAGWLAWWAMAAVRRHLARTREARVARLAADYARLVEGWGGRAVLESLESVEAVLRTTDPAAEPARPGFFRRLFGG
jgi:hypothetical protein